MSAMLIMKLGEIVACQRLRIIPGQFQCSQFIFDEYERLTQIGTDRIVSSEIRIQRRISLRNSDSVTRRNLHNKGTITHL